MRDGRVQQLTGICDVVRAASTTFHAPHLVSHELTAMSESVEHQVFRILGNLIYRPFDLQYIQKFIAMIVC